ncbi:MAG TPA: NFACT family protein, partial [Bacteroidota bacterium]|nr:NFACT family protein [Bacteroidota bacterium]
MLVHYLTLRAISAELYSLLSGAVIREVYTQNRDELTIACEAAGTERSLSISVDPALNFICSRNSASRAKRNTADLFPAFLGRTIRAIALAGFDRIVKVSTDDPDLTLFAQLYNTSSSNIVLADSSLIITGAFKNSARLVGQSFDLHDGRFDSNIFINIERFQDEIARNGEEPIGKRLKTLLPIFGSTYVREILFRVGIEEDRPSSACATSEIEQIFHEVVAVLAE